MTFKSAEEYYALDDISIKARLIPHGESYLRESLATSIKQTENPKTYPNSTNNTISIIEKYWWQLIIPVIVLIIGLVIQNIYFK